MTGRLHQFRAPSLSSLEESKVIYLQTLRTNAPYSTFLSHQNALRKFFSWYSSQVDRTQVPEKTLAKFVEHLLNSVDLRVDTVVGHVHSLLNYIAFHHQSNPETLRVRLIPEIQSLSCSESEKEALVNKFGCNANPEITCSVDALRTYLQRRQYGTRTHTFVEFIYTTTARPKQIRDLNQSDLNLDEQTASIALPETHVVAASGLHERRTVPLSPHLTDLLDTYIEYERDTPPQSDSQPLFTTTHGRASVGTLRRGVKLASEKALENHDATCESNLDGQSTISSVKQVVPSDVWKAGLNEVENTQ